MGMRGRFFCLKREREPFWGSGGCAPPRGIQGKARGQVAGRRAYKYT